MGRTALLLCLCVGLVAVAAGTSAPEAATNRSAWKGWIQDFGHDVYEFPAFLSEEMAGCSCQRSAIDGAFSCTFNGHSLPSLSGVLPSELTFCSCKAWMLNRMPEFDLHFLPPSVSVRGTSMLDDDIAFAIMALRQVTWADSLPIGLVLPYILPYATFHESRVNWRPVFFAKFFELVASASSTTEAMSFLVAPNVFLNWTGHPFFGQPAQPKSDYTMRWLSSTTPPVLSPFDFVAYGYASCSGWATIVTYLARAMGIPARQAGTPCWNGGEFAGLAVDNPNVTLCWHGGNSTNSGAKFLNNHNWVEYWDNEKKRWVYVNVPPGTSTPDAGLCQFDPEHGCNYSNSTGCSAITGGPGAAMRDHEIFSVTWSLPGESEELQGGPMIDVANLRLSNGEAVSPLVWSPNLKSPAGEVLKNIGLRVVNRTDFYRCRV